MNISNHVLCHESSRNVCHLQYYISSMVFIVDQMLKLCKGICADQCRGAIVILNVFNSNYNQYDSDVLGF